MVPYVIIGGDAAGMSAASKIKREQPDADVIVFERSAYISYSACGMPYWIAGVVESDRKLIVLTPERARERRGIDVRIGHTVTAIDPAQQTVTVYRSATDETFTQPYTKLLIATGASAVKPPLPGLDLPGVFTLRTIPDAQQIFHYLEEQAPKQAVIIGGGYIAMEMAEALHARGVAVTVIEVLPQIMATFDSDMVEEVTSHLVEKGIKLYTDRRVEQVTQQGTKLNVQLSSGEEIGTDLVLVSTGVRPNRELAEAAGLKLGKTGAIWVDTYMRTSDPQIYAAGDCVEHYHLVLGENAWIPLATSANKGGRIAGDNMSGNPSQFPGIMGTAVVKIFDYTLAITGVTEHQAIQSGKWGAQGEDVGSTVVSAWEKAGYWPGAEKIKVKLIYTKSTGQILGGQIVGKAGVNKRIDIIATAISARLNVETLGMLDLSYAPPYSPTYDPVQVCANVAARGSE
ncbi:MAG: FAD-dependent oxidoreductase [Caldilineaceae bacterium]|nr:FAD-dependent oxidoreductase [Caldilineaceae bacterium]